MKKKEKVLSKKFNFKPNNFLLKKINDININNIIFKFMIRFPHTKLKGIRENIKFTIFCLLFSEMNIS